MGCNCTGCGRPKDCGDDCVFCEDLGYPHKTDDKANEDRLIEVQ